MKVGIYGGAFDPPHKTHLHVAQTVKEALQLDEVRFVPTKTPAHKAPTVATEEQRVEMVSLMIDGHDGLIVDEVELHRTGTSYSIDTIEFYKQNEPENEFYLIIGGDMVAYLPKWHRIDELVRKVHIVGVARPGYTITSDYPVTVVNIEETDTASSKIRKNLSLSLDVSHELPKIVLEYIVENKLYETN